MQWPRLDDGIDMLSKEDEKAMRDEKKSRENYKCEVKDLATCLTSYRKTIKPKQRVASKSRGTSSSGNRDRIRNVPPSEIGIEVANGIKPPGSHVWRGHKAGCWAGDRWERA